MTSRMDICDRQALPANPTVELPRAQRRRALSGCSCLASSRLASVGQALDCGATWRRLSPYASMAGVAVSSTWGIGQACEFQTGAGSC